MKIRKLLIVLVLTVINISSVYSQLNVKVNASNLLRFGNGKETILSTESKKEYFEELADVKLFVNDFLFGVRYEYDKPIEFGKSTIGISRRFIEYKKEGFTVRAGNYFELFEKGLSLNAFESRGLGFNNQLDGVKLAYKHTWKKVNFYGSILGGNLSYNDLTNPERIENYTVKAGNFSISPIKFVKFGGSYLYTTGNIPKGTNNVSSSTNITAELFEGNMDVNYKNVNFYVSYANKKTITDVDADNPVSYRPRGDGLYSSVSYTTGGFGATFEYKNYRFDLVTPNERSLTRATKTLPFQVPPTCVKEHSSTLLSRYPHQTDFNDEVGYQIDIFYSPKDNLTFNLNFSQASRHYDYEDTDPGVLTQYKRIERKNSFLPSMKDAFSPWWEIFGEAEYYYRKNIKFKVGFSRQYSVIYLITSPDNSDIQKTWTIPVEVKYDFMKIYSIKLNAELQNVNNSIRLNQKSFYNEYFSLAISRSPSLIIGGNMEFSNDEEDATGKKFWASAEITYKFNTSNSFSLSYGSERGGLKCSSGICRYVNPFNGFRLTVINNFNQ